MNSTDESNAKKRRRRCASELKRLLEEYAADLRAIIDKLRRKLN